MEEINKGKVIFDKIQKLTKLYEDKEDLYYSLLDLEYYGLYRDEEYKKTLGYIEMLNEYINEITPSYKESFNDTLNLLAYLKYTRFELPFLSNMDSLFNEHADKTFRRVFDIFYEKNLNVLMKADELYQNKYVEFKTGEKRTYKEQSIIDSVEEDVSRSFLTILQDAIEDPENIDIRHDLLNAKYNLIYLNPKIEQEMLLNEFKIGHSIPLSSEFYLGLMGIATPTSTSKIVALKKIKKELDEIDKFNNSDYDYNKTETILRSCYIRANMTLLTEKQVELLNEKYYTDLLLFPFDKSKSKNEMLITKTFTKSLKDKKKYFPQPLK